MKFRLLQPFQIEGRLWAIDREEAFTLGAEWGIVWGRLKSGAAFVEFVHLENRDRVSAMLTAQRRPFVVSPARNGFVSFAVSGLA